MSVRSRLPVDASTNSFGSFLNTSPINKSPSTRPHVSRNRYAPSDVPSASKMKQRISEAFRSSKNIIYSDQVPDLGVPGSSLPARNNDTVDLQQTRAPWPSFLLAAHRSLRSSSPSKRATGSIPSSLPPSSPPAPSSSGSGETEEPARFPHRATKRKYEPEDPFGLLRGQQVFSRLRRRHRRRHRRHHNAVGAPPRNPRNPLGLGPLENLSPLTPCAHSNATSTSGRAPASDSDFRLFPPSSAEPAHRGHRDRSHPENGNGNHPDPDGNGGSGGASGSDARLSDLLARLPRGRRPLLQQNSRGTSVSTTIEPPKAKAVGVNRREKQWKKKRAGDEASHLRGEDRVVRNSVSNVYPGPEPSLALLCMAYRLFGLLLGCPAGVRGTTRWTIGALQRS